MSMEIDERIVQMQFDNLQFERGVKETMGSLDRLKGALNLDGAASSFENLQNTIDNLTFTKLINSSTLAIERLLQVHRHLNNIVISAERTVKSMSIDQITAGWSKYANKTQAVQTIMAATAKDWSDTNAQMEYVTKQLEKLNWFTDETSYNFVDMTSNIGKFTSAGVKLEDAVTAMTGIANWAGISGANVQQASHAMYNLSQAMGAGVVMKLDWKSIQAANMSTLEFKQSVIDTALAMGKLKKAADGTIYSSINKKTGEMEVVTATRFEDTLADRWFTGDVLTEVLKKYGSFSDKLREYIDEIDKTTGKDISASEFIAAVDDFSKGGKKFDNFVKDTAMPAERLTEMLKTLSSAEYDIGRRSFIASQEAKTFAEALEATKDAVSTGWMNTFETIFGDYLQSKKLWTKLANDLWEIFAGGDARRNDILKAWADFDTTIVDEATGAAVKAREAFLGSFSNIFESFIHLLNTYRSAKEEIFDEDSVVAWFAHVSESMYKATDRFKSFVEQIELSEDALSNLKTLFNDIGRIAKNIIGPMALVLARLHPRLRLFMIIGTSLWTAAKNSEAFSRILYDIQLILNSVVSYAAKATDTISKLFSIAVRFITEIAANPILNALAAVMDRIVDAANKVLSILPGFGGILKKSSDLGGRGLETIEGHVSKLGQSTEETKSVWDQFTEAFNKGYRETKYAKELKTIAESDLPHTVDELRDTLKTGFSLGSNSLSDNESFRRSLNRTVSDTKDTVSEVPSITETLLKGSVGNQWVWLKRRLLNNTSEVTEDVEKRIVKLPTLSDVIFSIRNGALTQVRDKLGDSFKSVSKWLVAAEYKQGVFNSKQIAEAMASLGDKTSGRRLDDVFGGFFEGVDSAESGLHGIADVVRSIQLPEWMEGLRDFAANVIDKIADTIGWIKDKISGIVLPQWMIDIGDFFSEFFTPTSEEMTDHIVDAISGISPGSLVKAVTGAFKDMRDAVWETIRGDYGNGADRDALFAAYNWSDELIQAKGVNRVWSKEGEWLDGYEEMLESFRGINVALGETIEESAAGVVKAGVTYEKIEGQTKKSTKGTKTFTDYLLTWRNKLLINLPYIAYNAGVLWANVNTAIGIGLEWLNEKLGSAITKLRKLWKESIVPWWHDFQGFIGRLQSLQDFNLLKNGSLFENVSRVFNYLVHGTEDFGDAAEDNVFISFGDRLTEIFQNAKNKIASATVTVLDFLNRLWHIKELTIVKEEGPFGVIRTIYEYLTGKRGLLDAAEVDHNTVGDIINNSIEWFKAKFQAAKTKVIELWNTLQEFIRRAKDIRELTISKEEGPFGIIKTIYDYFTGKRGLLDAAEVDHITVGEMIDNFSIKVFEIFTSVRAFFGRLRQIGNLTIHEADGPITIVRRVFGYLSGKEELAGAENALDDTDNQLGRIMTLGERAKTFIENFLESAYDVATGLWRVAVKVYNIASTAIGFVSKFVKDNWHYVVDAGSAIVGVPLSFAEKIWNALNGEAGDVLSNAASDFKTKFTEIFGDLESYDVNEIANRLPDLWGIISDFFITGWNGVKEDVTNVVNDASTFVTNAYNNVTSFITDMFSGTAEKVTSGNSFFSSLIPKQSDVNDTLASFSNTMDTVGVGLQSIITDFFSGFGFERKASLPEVFAQNVVTISETVLTPQGPEIMQEAAGVVEDTVLAFTETNNGLVELADKIHAEGNSDAPTAFSNIIAFVNSASGGITGILKAILVTKILRSGVKTVDAITTGIGAVSKGVGSVSGAIEELTKRVHRGGLMHAIKGGSDNWFIRLLRTLKQLVVIMGMLAGTIVLLGYIDESVFEAGLHRILWIVGIVAALGVAIGVFDAVMTKLAPKSNKKTGAKAHAGLGKSIAQMGAGLLYIAASLIVFKMAAKSFAKMDPVVLLKGFGIIAVLMTGIAVFSKNMGKDGSKGAAVEILSMAISMRILYSAIKKFGNMDAEVLKRGVAAAVGLLFAMALVVRLMGTVFTETSNLEKTDKKNKKSKSKSVSKTKSGLLTFLAMAGAILLLVPAIKRLGAMDTGELAQGILAISAIYLSMAVAIKSGENLKFRSALGMIALAAVMTELITIMVALPADKATIVKIVSLAILAAALGVAMYGISKVASMVDSMSLGKVIKSMGKLILTAGAVVLTLTVVVGLIWGINKVLRGNLKNVLNEVTPAIGALGELIGAFVFGFIGQGIASFVNSIRSIDSEALKKVAAILGGTIVGALAIIAVCAWVKKKFDIDVYESAKVGVKSIALIVGILGAIFTAIGFLEKSLFDKQGPQLTISHLLYRSADVMKALAGALSEIAIPLGLMIIAAVGISEIGVSDKALSGMSMSMMKSIGTIVLGAVTIFGIIGGASQLSKAVVGRNLVSLIATAKAVCIQLAGALEAIAVPVAVIVAAGAALTFISKHAKIESKGISATIVTISAAIGAAVVILTFALWLVAMMSDALKESRGDENVGDFASRAAIVFEKVTEAFRTMLIPIAVVVGSAILLCLFIEALSEGNVKLKDLTAFGAKILIMADFISLAIGSCMAILAATLGAVSQVSEMWSKYTKTKFGKDSETMIRSGASIVKTTASTFKRVAPLIGTIVGAAAAIEISEEILNKVLGKSGTDKAGAGSDGKLGGIPTKNDYGWGITGNMIKLTTGIGVSLFLFSAIIGAISQLNEQFLTTTKTPYTAGGKTKTAVTDGCTMVKELSRAFKMVAAPLGILVGAAAAIEISEDVIESVLKKGSSTTELGNKNTGSWNIATNMMKLALGISASIFIFAVIMSILSKIVSGEFSLHEMLGGVTAEAAEVDDVDDTIDVSSIDVEDAKTASGMVTSLADTFNALTPYIGTLIAGVIGLNIAENGIATLITKLNSTTTVNTDRKTILKDILTFGLSVSIAIGIFAVVMSAVSKVNSLIQQSTNDSPDISSKDYQSDIKDNANFVSELSTTFSDIMPLISEIAEQAAKVTLASKALDSLSKLNIDFSSIGVTASMDFKPRDTKLGTEIFLNMSSLALGISAAMGIFALVMLGVSQLDKVFSNYSDGTFDTKKSSILRGATILQSIGTAFDGLGTTIKSVIGVSGAISLLSGPLQTLITGIADKNTITALVPSGTKVDDKQAASMNARSKSMDSFISSVLSSSSLAAGITIVTAGLSLSITVLALFSALVAWLDDVFTGDAQKELGLQAVEVIDESGEVSTQYVYAGSKIERGAKLISEVGKAFSECGPAIRMILSVVDGVYSLSESMASQIGESDDASEESGVAETAVKGGIAALTELGGKAIEAFGKNNDDEKDDDKSGWDKLKDTLAVGGSIAIIAGALSASLLLMSVFAGLVAVIDDAFTDTDDLGLVVTETKNAAGETIRTTKYEGSAIERGSKLIVEVGKAFTEAGETLKTIVGITAGLVVSQELLSNALGLAGDTAEEAEESSGAVNEVLDGIQKAAETADKVKEQLPGGESSDSDADEAAEDEKKDKDKTFAEMMGISGGLAVSMAMISASLSASLFIMSVAAGYIGKLAHAWEVSEYDDLRKAVEDAEAAADEADVENSADSIKSNDNYITRGAKIIEVVGSAFNGIGDILKNVILAAGSITAAFEVEDTLKLLKISAGDAKAALPGQKFLRTILAGFGMALDIDIITSGISVAIAIMSATAGLIGKMSESWFETNGEEYDFDETSGTGSQIENGAKIIETVGQAFNSCADTIKLILEIVGGIAAMAATIEVVSALSGSGASSISAMGFLKKMLGIGAGAAISIDMISMAIGTSVTIMFDTFKSIVQSIDGLSEELAGDKDLYDKDGNFSTDLVVKKFTDASTIIQGVGTAFNSLDGILVPIVTISGALATAATGISVLSSFSGGGLVKQFLAKWFLPGAGVIGGTAGTILLITQAISLAVDTLIGIVTSIGEDNENWKQLKTMVNTDVVKDEETGKVTNQAVNMLTEGANVLSTLKEPMETLAPIISTILSTASSISTVAAGIGSFAGNSIAKATGGGAVKQGVFALIGSAVTSIAAGVTTYVVSNNMDSAFSKAITGIVDAIVKLKEFKTKVEGALGDQTLEELTEELTPLMGSVGTFFGTLFGSAKGAVEGTADTTEAGIVMDFFNDIEIPDTSKVESVLGIIDSLSKTLTDLAPTTGHYTWNNLGWGLEGLGEHLKHFFETLRTETDDGYNWEEIPTVDYIRRLGLFIHTLASSMSTINSTTEYAITESGEIVGPFEVMSIGLSTLGQEIAGFVEAMGELIGSDVDSAIIYNGSAYITSVALACETLNDIPTDVPEQTKIRSYMDNLGVFADGVVEYAQKVDSLTDDQLDKLTTIAPIMEAVAAIASAFDEISEWQLGDVIFDEVTGLLPTMMEQLVRFATEMAAVPDVDTDMLSNISSIIGSTTDFVNALLGLGDTDVITQLGNTMINLGHNAILNFVGGLIDGDSTSKVKDAAYTVSKSLADSIINDVTKGTNAGVPRWAWLASKICNLFTTALTTTELVKITTAAGTIAKEFAYAIRNATVSDAGLSYWRWVALGVMNDIVDNLNSYIPKITSAGANVGQGFADGILSKQQVIANASTTAASAGVMPFKAVPEVQSPSKVTRGIGAFVSLGYALGIKDNQGLVERNASDVAFGSIDVMREILARSEAMLNEDVEPVISPVIDLSNVDRSIGQIGGLFNSSRFVAGVSLQNAEAIQMQSVANRTKQQRTDSNNFEDIRQELVGLRHDMNTLSDDMSHLQVVMDSGALVGSISGKMDTSFARRTVYRDRRN